MKLNCGDYIDLDSVLEQYQKKVPDGERLTRNEVKQFEAIFHRLAEISNGGWVSVKDRMPDLDGEYLCWFGDYPMGAHYRICRYTNGKGFYCYTDNFKWPFITHWMPLPEPPKEGD